MSAVRLFQQPEYKEEFPAFKDELFADIDQYINDRKDKWYKKTGVDRANYLKNFIEKVLSEQEQLTTTQLMWRLYSYATMVMGDGPLDTSKDLRVIILDRICTSLGVKKEDINSKLSERLDTAMSYAVAAGGRTANYVDSYKIGTEVRAEQVSSDLVKRIAAPEKNASHSTQKLMNLLLITIEGYIFKSTHSGWFTRWLTRDGVARAEALKKHIINQLVIKERLNDKQLFARVLEMASQGFGEGILGTSRDLRNELLKTMCCWNKLHLDQAAINNVIDLRSEATIMPNVTVMGGGYIHVPDPAMESIQYRVEVLHAAKKELFQSQKPVQEEMRAVLSN